MTESQTARPAQRRALACTIRDLTVTYRVDGREYPALRNIRVDIRPGEITAVIGESGSGKSTLALAMMNAVSAPGRITAGTVRYPGIGDITAMTPEQMRQIRGSRIAMVFQASQNSLNPLRRVGAQILDLAQSHGIHDRRAVLAEAKALAAQMALDPDRILTAYQHQLSGGMRQRVGIILSLVLQPEFILMDEPTTALDVLSQSAVLEIIRRIQQERHLTTVLVTHDMGVVAEVAAHVVVLYAGRVVEQGPVTEILRTPRHPYTQALIRAIPRLTGDPDTAQALAGQPPALARIPQTGCVFRDRCSRRFARCETIDPPMIHWGPQHGVACHWEEAQS